MSNLKKVEGQNLNKVERYKDLCPDLTEAQKEIISIRNTETLRQLQNRDKNVFNAVLIEAFTKALNLAGQKKEVDDYKNQLSNYVEAFSRNIRIGEYQSLTPGELTLSIRKGVGGEFGDFQGINYKTLNKFVKSYLAEANTAITKQRIYEGRKESEKIEEERKAKARKDWENPEKFQELIQKDIDQKAKNPKKEIQDFGSHKCKRLIREGKIVIDPEFKQGFINKAVEEYRKEEERKKQKSREVKTIQYREPTEETEKIAKNRIYFSLIYNDWLLNETL